MNDTKSSSEKKIKPKVGPLGGNALISRRAATWSPHLCLRLAEIVAENTFCGFHVFLFTRNVFLFLTSSLAAAGGEST